MKFNPYKFTEASHQHSFPKASRQDEAKMYKQSFAPGPGTYETGKKDKREGYEFSFKGGPLEKK